MKRTVFVLAMVLAGALFSETCSAMTPAVLPPVSGTILFVQDAQNDYYFITPLSGLDPRLTGANKWTMRKWISGGLAGTQISLGYMADFGHALIPPGWHLDAWLENPPVKYPFEGQRCLLYYDSKCDPVTDYYAPTKVDQDGFYHTTIPVGAGAVYNHALLSANMFSYLRDLPVGNDLSVTYDTCYTTKDYDPNKGQYCRDLPNGSGYYWTRKQTWTKGGHLTLDSANTQSIIYLAPDGTPYIPPGDTNCTSDNKGGLICGAATYNLQSNGYSGLGGGLITMSPVISKDNPNISPAYGDLKLSFSKSGTWRTSLTYKQIMANGSNGTFYLYYTASFLKKMVKAINNNQDNVVHLLLYNAITPESGYYEFIPSHQVVFEPIKYNVSISAKNNESHPVADGVVGKNSPPIDFDYVIRTTGKTAADQVKVNLIGPSKFLNGVRYCDFQASGANPLDVPFPAQLEYSDSKGELKRINDNCAGNTVDITNAAWLTTPWMDETGTLYWVNSTDLSLIFPMDNPVSLKTFNNKPWDGVVSANGQIQVKAIWHTGN